MSTKVMPTKVFHEVFILPYMKTIERDLTTIVFSDVYKQRMALIKLVKNIEIENNDYRDAFVGLVTAQLNLKQPDGSDHPMARRIARLQEFKRCEKYLLRLEIKYFASK